MHSVEAYLHQNGFRRAKNCYRLINRNLFLQSAKQFPPLFLHMAHSSPDCANPQPRTLIDGFNMPSL